MALVSMLSVRISNPRCRIILLCDAESAGAIKSTKHRVLDVCDEMMSVDTPTGNPTFRNRWIKTQLCNYVSGSALYLDVDTLLREDVSGISNLVANIGFVPNHNGKNIQDQLWNEDKHNLQLHGWNVSLQFYPNGGVFFYSHNLNTLNFFKLWHKFWLKDWVITGRGRDQSPLYAALAESAIAYDELPYVFNFQFSYPITSMDNIAIMHFYTGRVIGIENILGKLLDAASHVSTGSLKKLVRNSLRHPNGWPNNDVISKLILKTRMPDKFSVSNKLWLLGRKRSSMRMLASEYLNKIFKGVKNKT